VELHPGKPRELLETIDAIAAMQPATIVAGHRDPDAPDDDTREVRQRKTAGPCEIPAASRCSRFQPGPDGRESLFELCLIDDAAHQQRVRECNQPVLWVGQV
jgi:hypothetical protein